MGGSRKGIKKKTVKKLAIKKDIGSPGANAHTDQGEGFEAQALCAKSYLLQWIYCTVFGLMIATPLALFWCWDEAALENEKETALPSFTFQRYWSGDFQREYDLWFSTHYPLRGQMVHSYRQLRMDIENIPFGPAALLRVLNGTLSSDTRGDWMDVAYNPMYAEINEKQRSEKPVEPSGFKGSDAVLVGKSGYLYESVYIDEYCGFLDVHRNITDEQLRQTVDILSYIQKELAKREIAFVYLLTPSKASQYPDYLPQWYLDKNVAPENYTRPYLRLREMLAASDVNYIDSAALLKEVGLACTFPKTGIHWNKLAAVEAIKEVLQVYEDQTGKTPRTLVTDAVYASNNPPNFGNPEQDIYNILYSGINAEGSIIDDAYYWPLLHVNNQDAEPINVLVQGGSFCWDFTHYFPLYGISNIYRQFYYNNLQGDKTNDPFGEQGIMAWEGLLQDIDYVIFECNEQQVRGVMPEAESILARKQDPAVMSNAIYASLYWYLRQCEQNGEG